MTTNNHPDANYRVTIEAKSPNGSSGFAVIPEIVIDLCTANELVLYTALDLIRSQGEDKTLTYAALAKRAHLSVGSVLFAKASLQDKGLLDGILTLSGSIIVFRDVWSYNVLWRRYTTISKRNLIARLLYERKPVYGDMGWQQILDYVKERE